MFCGFHICDNIVAIAFKGVVGTEQPLYCMYHRAAMYACRVFMFSCAPSKDGRLL